MSAIIRVLIVATLAGAGAGRVHAQDLLATVRAHYGAAEYEAALTLLTTADAGLSIESDRIAALCLLALGRPAEADVHIERVVLAQPEYEPAAEASPRIRAAFRAVRVRVLPAYARRLYDAGKAAFERRAFAEAAATFERALPLLEILALEGRMDMEGLRVLATDFMWLSRQLTPPPVEPLKPLDARMLPLESFMPIALAVEAAPQIPAAPAPVGAPRVETTTPDRPRAEAASTDASLTPPVPIQQVIPPWRFGLGGPEATFSGAVDVRIDADGRVVDAALVKSVHPLYDKDLLRSALGWRYQPALRAGRAVTSSKRVEVMLRNR